VFADAPHANKVTQSEGIPLTEKRVDLSVFVVSYPRNASGRSERTANPSLCSLQSERSPTRLSVLHSKDQSTPAIAIRK